MPVTPSEFKQALGRFASGVTVVAVDIGDETHGMTASAFLSVSLDPPLVLVSVAKKAHMHAHLLGGARWTASILNAEQSAQSSHFAGYGPADVVWHRDTGGGPRLDGAIAWVACTPFAAHDAGDHTLFVGQVEASAVTDGEPLVYAKGKYWGLVAG